MNKPINIQSFVCEVDKCPDIQRLKAENEELKEEYKQFQHISVGEVHRLRKALEEVREITKKYYLPDKKLLATGIGINPYGAIIEIQEKINEVLNG